MQKISIVIPCFNEEENVPLVYGEAVKLASLYNGKYEFEFVFTDNQSTDSTFSKICALAYKDPRVKLIRFSRNLGSTRAILFGMSKASGDAVIILQADLQDPPELIPQFIENWEKGYDVVYGTILNRTYESVIIRTLRKLFYYIVDNFSDVPIPRNAGEFRLTSQRATKSILAYQESRPYLRGIAAHIGYKSLPISYERRPRKHGESKAPFFYLVNFAIYGLTAVSTAPLRFIGLVGLALGSAGVLLSIYFVLMKLILPNGIPTGLTTIVVLVSLFGGLNFFLLGIIAEYLSRIYVETLNRPLGFIQEEINFHEPG